MDETNETFSLNHHPQTLDVETAQAGPPRPLFGKTLSNLSKDLFHDRDDVAFMALEKFA